MRPTRTRVAAAALTAALLGGACSGLSSSRSAETSALQWAACGEEDLKGLECARLAVPLDHDDPTGPSIEIALSRLPAAEPAERVGSLVINPGGPGGSGVDAVAQLRAALSADLLARYDLVGFDPRGVGASTSVRCIPDYDAMFGLDPAPDSGDEAEASAALVRSVVDACTAEHGALLAHLGAVDTARDLDLIRAALGDEQLTYLGYSYGTLLGATYTALFPERVRAMVLDGAVGPNLTPDELMLTQARSFDRALERFAAACRDDARCAAGPDALALFDRVLAQAEASPVASTRSSETRTLTPGWLHTGVAAALYDSGLWTVLARSLSDADRGDTAGLLALADNYAERGTDGTYPNALDAQVAISCADESPRARTDPAGRLDAFRAAAPRFGPAAAWSLGSCEHWPAAAHAPVRLAAYSGAPVLVIGTLGDPATPYDWAANLVDVLGSAVLLTAEGDRHTAYPTNACVAAAVDWYLLQGAAPVNGTRCAASLDELRPFSAAVTEYRDQLLAAGLSDEHASCAAEKIVTQLPTADLLAVQTNSTSLLPRLRVDAIVEGCAAPGSRQ